MEELSAALKGKPKSECRIQHASSYDLSADSLEIISQKHSRKEEGKENVHCEETLLKNSESFCLNESEASSNYSIQSEPITGKLKNKPDFISIAMTEYLNSHRHSLSSVMELIDNRSFGYKTCNTHKSFIAKTMAEEEIFQYSSPEENTYEESTHEPFYILSPIEEKSEPSTGSSSLKDSNGSDQKKSGYDRLKKYSSSCNAICYNTTNLKDVTSKFKTFPRIKSENTSTQIDYYSGYYDNMYSLEPREIDPSSFYQLHTADSQEELQEFLLLESECMDDSTQDNGIASAFLASTDESSDVVKQLSNKGNMLSNDCAAY